MWWYSFWGKWRYSWLEHKMKQSLCDKENVDDIFRTVFNTISFTEHHTKEELDSLLRCIELRNVPNEGTTFVTGVFSLETICRIAQTIPSSANHRTEWEVVFMMTTLRDYATNGMDRKLLEATALNMESVLAKDASNVNCGKVLQILRSRLQPLK